MTGRPETTIEGIIEVAIFRELQRQEADTHRLPNPIYVAIDEPFEISMVVRAVIGSLYDNGYQILHEVAMPDPMGAAMSAHSNSTDDALSYQLEVALEHLAWLAKQAYEAGKRASWDGGVCRCKNPVNQRPLDGGRSLD